MRTLEELKKAHNEVVEANRRKPVAVGYGADKPADVVLEVVEGKHCLPSRNVSTQPNKVQLQRGETMWPGQRFIPSVEQMKAGKGGLLGAHTAPGENGAKFRVVEGASAKTITRDNRKAMAQGADIGLRSLNFGKEALKAALDAGLEVEDFANIAPGKFGRYSLEQVQAVIEAKGGNQN